MKQMGSLVRTIVFFTFFWLSVLILLPLGVLLFVLSLLGLKSFTDWVLIHLASWWAQGVIWGTGAQVTVEGLEHIPPRSGLCFIGNHPGDFDVILALAYIPRRFGFIAKKEVLFLPFVNLWVLLLGGLFIDRKNIAKGKRAIEQGAERIKKGASMIIFPEGTRSRGRGILPFKAGAFKLATLANAPIVPLVIHGSYSVWEETGLIQSVPVHLKFLHPIETAPLDAEARRALPKQVEALIREELDQLAG
ncbi:lysophospholipid acyltransferase family protein [Gracilinema caldarium]|uniref:1-acyl-sn-glycerol-3-phosphate acyltransferase n=1 Tax=Gracilinema caldarium (strain ATCC 51460 / DSM 7334 / H1) TaxID=744872 RepID=F8F0Q3_GRAC1|nr:lysophospholipid acyltransferase family protein [Gracilinema caldarium]AEJ19760.1 1-acyl-sn-glycerol-3-phosphate acyltransferase [Gracilinema caldarium DSM 7334]